MATADAGPVIAIAAEPLEFGGLLRHARRTRPLRWPIAFARTAEIDGREWILAAHGPGPRLARQAAETALEQCGSRSLLLSTGFCGGLSPELAAGQIFVAENVTDSATARRYPASPVSCALPHRTGVLWSQDRVAVTAGEKAAIAALGADAVDMEAAAVAAVAEARGVQFFCVRVISDGAGEELPLDFNRFRGPEGRFSRMRITSELLLHPSKLIVLLRFRGTCRRAAQQLGDFLVQCRF